MRYNVCFLLLFFVLLLFECVGASPKPLERSKEGCQTCGRKTDKSKFRTVSEEDKEYVVGAFSLQNYGGGDLCAACYRTVRKFKASGEKAVSVSTTSRTGPKFKFRQRRQSNNTRNTMNNIFNKQVNLKITVKKFPCNCLQNILHLLLGVRKTQICWGCGTTLGPIIVGTPSKWPAFL